MRLLLGENGSVFVLRNNTCPNETVLQKLEKTAFAEILSTPKNFPDIDFFNTLMLSVEVPARRVNIENSKYINNLTKPVTIPANTADRIFVGKPVDINLSAISPFVNRIGITLERQDIYAHVNWDEQENRIILKDKKGEEIELSLADTDGKRITFFNEILSFSLQDYKKILETEQSIASAYEQKKGEYTYWDISHQVTSKLSDKDYFMYQTYANNKERDNLLNKVIAHEIKHIRDDLIIENRSLKPDSRNLSVEDEHQREIDKEKSAYLEEMFVCINEYLQQGDYNNLKLFGEEHNWILKSIFNKSPQEINKVLSNHKFLVSTALDKWNKSYSEVYGEQVSSICAYNARRRPLCKKEDENRKEYFLHKSILYSFRLYNPITHKYEQKDLSSCVADSSQQISRDFATNINLCKCLIKKRQADRLEEVENGEINEGLVVEATKMSRDYFSNSAVLQSKYNYVEGSLPNTIALRLNSMGDSQSLKNFKPVANRYTK